MRSLSSRNWFGRASAGLLLGFTLAIALSGVVAVAAGAGSDSLQLVMWMVAPVWCAAVSLCFLFVDGRRAWLWLGLANLACFSILFGLRALS